MIHEQKKVYSIGLILSNSSKRTCAAMSKIIHVNEDFLLRCLDKETMERKEYCDIVKNIFTRKKLYFLGDDSLLQKLYANLIEGTCYNYDSSIGRCYKSICTVTGMITDGIDGIPVDHRIWVSPEIKGSKEPKKTDLMQELIAEIRKYIDIEIVICDGLYATTGMLEWLNQSDIPYEMRFHANRVVNNGKKLHEIFNFKQKWKFKTKKVTWHGMHVYITAVKRVDKNGNKTVVYQISNHKVAAKKHVEVYSYRWNIEKFFRTAKQYLGFAHCQSRKIKRQSNHIRYVFLAYAFTVYVRRKLRLKTPEEAIRAIKEIKVKNT